MGHFPSNHHRGPFCLQMFDARPYGRVKRLKILDIKISINHHGFLPLGFFLVFLLSRRAWVGGCLTPSSSS